MKMMMVVPACLSFAAELRVLQLLQQLKSLLQHGDGVRGVPVREGAPRPSQAWMRDLQLQPRVSTAAIDVADLLLRTLSASSKTISAGVLRSVLDVTQGRDHLRALKHAVWMTLLQQVG
jgi:hypothetical protein